MQGFWNLIGKSGQGPGKDFQYEISEKISSSLDTKSLWSLHHGKKKRPYRFTEIDCWAFDFAISDVFDKMFHGAFELVVYGSIVSVFTVVDEPLKENNVTAEIVSVFVCDGKSSTSEELHLAKSACKRLKTLRHPNIITFLDAFESENLVYVVTEPVIPLSTFLDEEDGRNPNLITWGLHQVITGLSFLINDGNLLHENVNIYSVFVGLDGEWKLGGVEYVHTANTDSVAKLACLSCYDPPEVKTGNKIKEKWSSDAWGLGCLIWEIYNGALQNSSDLKNIKKIPKPLVVHYCDLVSANPKSRTNPKLFLEKTKEPGQFLCNDFIKANLFLGEIQIKDQKEQKDFFSSLDKTLDSFPKQFCVHKVLPQLLNAFEYGTAGSAVLSPLFKVGLLLDEAAYQAKILPCIIKLFSSNDRATRIQLLQQMEKFIKHLQPSVVDSQIFPCVSTGFGDTLPAMREQTIKAMLLLTPKLSEKTINNNLLRYFAKLQMDEQPGIRTNTTICLGRIAQHLSTATRQKVLIPAFARALRDPFPPARRAGVQSISATQEYYKITDVSTKLLPALCNLLVDPEQNVRDNTFILVKALMKKLEEYSKDPNSALNNQEVAEKEANGEGSTWTGWAVTSITSRFYQQKQETQNSVPSQHNNDMQRDSSGKDENHSNQSNSHPIKLKVAQPEEQDVSDSSDYNDAWGDEEWQDVKEETLESTNVQTSIIGKTDSKFNVVNQFDARQNNDSDSDYGDEWGDSGWGDEKAKDSGVLDGNELNDWGNNKAYECGDNSWNDGATEQDAKKKKKTTDPKNKPDEPSVAQLLGLSSDGNDFLTGQPDVSWGGGWGDVENVSGSVTSKPIASAAVKKEVDSKQTEVCRSDWGGDSWGDGEDWEVGEKAEEERKKEQRKLELQRKREERKQQREQANKEKRTAKSGGALKLGAVKKGS